MKPFERDRITIENLLEAYELTVKDYEEGDDKLLDAIEVIIPFFGHCNEIMKLEILKELRKD